MTKPSSAREFAERIWMAVVKAEESPDLWTSGLANLIEARDTEIAREAAAALQARIDAVTEVARKFRDEYTLHVSEGDRYLLRKLSAEILAALAPKPSEAQPAKER